MADQEYVLNGTISGIVTILENDFGMSHDEARFFTYVLLDRPNRDVANAVDKDDLDEWYLNEEKCECQILGTHFVLSFTSLKKSMCHSAYTFFAKFFFSREIDILLLGADLVYYVISSIKYIEDTDYCIFSRIVELCIGNKDRLFGLSDIVTANKDNKCDYQDDEWRCPYLGKDDVCTCNEEKVSLTLRNLENKNVIRKVGNMWMLQR